MHIVLRINLHSENSHFNETLSSEGFFISRLYTMLLRHACIKGVNRINIEFSPKFERPRIDPVLYSVLSIFWPFHPEKDLEETIELKRWQLISNELSKVLHKTFLKNGWETQIVRNAEEALLSSGFDQNFELTKEKSSPDRKFKARVVLNPRLNSNDIIAEISKGKEWNKEVLLFKLDLAEFEYSILSKKIVWINDILVSIIGLKGEVAFEINVHDFAIERIINPIVHSEEYIKEELLILDANTTKNTTLHILRKRLPESLHKLFE